MRLSLVLLFFLLKKYFIYLTLVVLGLHCCADFALDAMSRDYSLVVVRLSHCCDFPLQSPGSRVCGLE